MLAYDEATGTTGLYTVTATWHHRDPLITTLTIAGEEIETTPEHPFYVMLRGWVLAGDLREGDYVRLEDGSYTPVEATETVYDPQVMYNMTVAEAHTYFVGDDGCTVHNAKKDPCYSVVFEALLQEGIHYPDPNTELPWRSDRAHFRE